jgi:hypothetical protein
MDWIELAHDRNQLRAHVNMVINVRFGVFTAMTIKNAVFYDVASRRSVVINLCETAAR